MTTPKDKILRAKIRAEKALIPKCGWFRKLVEVWLAVEKELRNKRGKRNS